MHTCKSQLVIFKLFLIWRYLLYYIQKTIIGFKEVFIIIFGEVILIHGLVLLQKIHSAKWIISKLLGCHYFTKTLHDLIHTDKMRNYLIHKSKVQQHQLKQIDWDARKKTHNNMTKTKNTWACKWLTGFCSIGIMLNVYKYQKHAKCPRCNADNESLQHVLKCPDTRAQQLWFSEIDKLHTWIIDNKGCPELALAIRTYLHSWHHQSPTEPMSWSPTLTRAIWEQNAIGWTSFLEGIWSQQWRVHQHQYLQSIKSQRSSILWISKAQRQIWQIAWEMWNQRNNILHSDRKTIHQYETALLDSEIRTEWSRRQRLPAQYNHLFNGTLENRLQSSTLQKQRWIVTVWAAQESQ